MELFVKYRLGPASQTSLWTVGCGVTHWLLGADAGAVDSWDFHLLSESRLLVNSGLVVSVFGNSWGTHDDCFHRIVAGYSNNLWRKTTVSCLSVFLTFWLPDFDGFDGLRRVTG